MRFSNEIKVGLVVVVAVAIGLMFFVKTKDFSKRTYTLKAYFKYAGDLKPNAVVKLAGVESGRIKDIKFVYDPATKVECILEIEDDARVREDSVAYITSTGIVGDACLGITPGVSDKFVKPGSIIASEDPVQMRLIMKRADSIANNLDKILVEVKSVVTDNRQNLDNIVINIEKTTENFREFSADIKKHPWKIMFKGE